MESVLAHNERAAATWGSGGRAYERISELSADALRHVVDRLLPQPGERVVDVATGTGWTVRLLADCGAVVSAVDIGDGLIEAAKRMAPEIDFRVGDAEALPFGDQSFDAVSSTFGVMFVAQPEAAARELARVCRKGGRIGLATWVRREELRACSPSCAGTCPHRPAPHPRPSNGGGRNGFGNC